MGISTTLAVILVAVVSWWYLRTARGPGRVFVSQANASYDYIVVGSGSAGAIVASRLSEDPQVTVLLVEAGGNDDGDQYISTPSLAPAIQVLDSQVVDNFYTEPDKARYKGLKNGQAKWPRGRVLGGSSSINYMLYVRGSRHDFDRWAAYTGDETWNYNHILPYFKRSEKILDPELAKSVYHGREGAVGITRKRIQTSSAQMLLEGFRELGFRFNEDLNGRSMEGIAPAQENIDNGQRSNTARAFLRPAVDRPNLHILLYSRVQKVVIRNKRVEGVEVIKDGRKYIVGARREVILSAGALESPQILMLSGIGPRKHLEEFHIPVVADLPVGENLHDHTLVDVPITFRNGESTKSSALTDFWNLLNYKLFGTGPMSTMGSELNLYTSTTQENKAKDWPDVQLMLIASNIVVGSDYLSMMNVAPDLVKSYAYRDHVPHSALCASCVMRPTSRGHLKLASRNPFDHPVLIPNYYSTPEDVETMLKGVDICQKLPGTKALSRVQAEIVDNQPLNICQEHAVGSNDHWACVMKSRPHTVFHHVGTCKMGAANDSSAVVDPQLKVRGIAGLRVADGSIMPFIVTANTNAAIMMIGEKAADLIRGQRLEALYNV